MKEKPVSRYLEKTQPVPVQSGEITKFGLDISHLSTSVSKVNGLFIAWLESLGVAGAGQSDEHLEPAKKESRL